MRRWLIAAVVLGLLALEHAAPAAAQTTWCSTIGSFTWCSETGVGLTRVGSMLYVPTRTYSYYPSYTYLPWYSYSWPYGGGGATWGDTSYWWNFCLSPYTGSLC